jgi:hypothetical protein
VSHVTLEALQRTDFKISGYQKCHGWVEAQGFGVPLSPPSEDMWKGSVSPWHTYTIRCRCMSFHAPAMYFCRSVKKWRRFLFTWTLMTEIKQVAETLDFDDDAMRLIAQERFMDHSLLYMLIRVSVQSNKQTSFQQLRRLVLFFCGATETMWKGESVTIKIYQVWGSITSTQRPCFRLSHKANINVSQCRQISC